MNLRVNIREEDLEKIIRESLRREDIYVKKFRRISGGGGASLAITIPADVVRRLNIKHGDYALIYLDEKNDAIIIKPINVTLQVEVNKEK